MPTERKVLVLLDEAEAAALADARRGMRDFETGRLKLRSALDKEGTERKEWRVVGQGREREERTPPLPSREHAETRAWELANPDSRLVRPLTEIRIQSRTITTFEDGAEWRGPRRDLEGEDG